jgi:hypothetical protein
VKEGEDDERLKKIFPQKESTVGCRCYIGSNFFNLPVESEGSEDQRHLKP